MEAQDGNVIAERLKALVSAKYVFADVAEKICEVIATEIAKGAYCGAENEAELANLLVRDLRSINNDRHLDIEINRDLVERMRSADESDRPQDDARRDNYGFEAVDKLKGHIGQSIGYLKLTEFANVAQAGETAVNVMQKFVGCTHLIVDVRNNGGGSPAMVQLITTYLFGYETVHLNDFYLRETGIRDQFWTLPYVPGERLDNVKVFVLTSHRTFSAAEEFCYNLQVLKRGTIIGEVTGGGAHPGDEHVIGEESVVFIPHGRAINPVTQTNWETVGVSPDFLVPAEDALELALEKINSEKVVIE